MNTINTLAQPCVDDEKNERREGDRIKEVWEKEREREEREEKKRK